MKITKGLARLAWGEIRFLSIIGLWIFTILPLTLHLIHRLASNSELDPLMGVSVNMFLGGFFALIIGIALTCPDQKSRLRDFWSSRPIPLFPLLWTKYLVGLGIVFVIPATSYIVDLMWDCFTNTFIFEESIYIPVAKGFIGYTLVHILLFSIAFLAGCLMRKGVEAALVSFGFGLIVYFFPLFFPPLEWFSVFSVIVLETISGSRFLLFGLFLLVGSGLAFIMAYQISRRDIVLRLNQKSILWCLGFVVIIIFTSGAYNYGSNLKCEQIVSNIDTRDRLKSITVTGDSVLIRRNCVHEKGVREMTLERYRFDPVEKDRLLEPASSVSLGRSSLTVPGRDQIVISEDNPDIGYTIVDCTSESTGQRCFDLCTISINPSTTTDVIQRMDLGPLFSKQFEKRDRPTVVTAVDTEIRKEIPPPENVGEIHLTFSIPYFTSCVHFDVSSATAAPLLHYCPGKLLIRFGDELATLTLSNPLAPTHEQTIPFNTLSRRFPDKKHPSIELPQIPDLSPQERFLVWMDFITMNQFVSLEGDILVRYDFTEKELLIFRVQGYDNEIIQLEYLCELYRMLPEYILEYIIEKIILHNSFLYAFSSGGVTVYDLHDPKNPRRAGHYVVPNEWFRAIAFLPDGKAILASDNLHVLTPPQ